MLGARVDDEELEADPAEVEGNLAGGHVGAVEGQGMALLAAHGGGLIESSRVGTRDLVFGDASGVDELTSSLVVGGLQRSRQTEGAHLVQGDGGRALQGGTRGKPSPEGDARPQCGIEAGDRAVSGLFQRPRHASEVRGPVVGHLARSSLGPKDVEIENVDSVAGLWRNQSDRSIGAGRERNISAVR